MAEIVSERGWVSAAQWSEFQSEFWASKTHGAEQFSRKLVSARLEGPFAFLVRGAALRQHDAHHRDFTATSEAVEDFASAFEELYGFPLLSAIKEAFRPCLVSFTQPAGSHRSTRAV
jgi:hypothetical protein